MVFLPSLRDTHTFQFPALGRVSDHYVQPPRGSRLPGCEQIKVMLGGVGVGGGGDGFCCLRHADGSQQCKVICMLFGQLVAELVGSVLIATAVSRNCHRFSCQLACCTPPLLVMTLVWSAVMLYCSCSYYSNCVQRGGGRIECLPML